MYVPEVGQRKGKWNDLEHKMMFIFIQKHKQDLVDYLKVNLQDNQRKNKRQFFNKMAAFIKTKDEKQCKSRYQKQEINLLEAANIPLNLLSTLKQRRLKGSRPSKSQKRLSIMTTEVTNSEDKPKHDRSGLSIHTYEDLKATLNNHFLPRIQNDVIKNQMERLLQVIPTETEPNEELSSFNLNSVSIILPQFGISLGSINDKASSFLDD